MSIFEKIKEKVNKYFVPVIVIIFVLLSAAWCFYSNEFYLKTVKVTYDYGYDKIVEKYETRKLRVKDFFLEAGIDYDSSKDELNVGYEDFLEEKNKITIKKGLDISFKVGDVEFSGNIIELDSKKELFDLFNIRYTKDFIYPKEKNSMINFMGSTWDSIKIKYRKEIKETPFEIEKVKSDEVQIGNVEIIQEGELGLDEEIYLDIYKDKEIVSSTLVRSEHTRDVKNCIKAVGYKFNWDIPEDLEYIDTMDIKAVSYNFDGHPYGVYGLNCTYGTVAVDRSLIPLGTKMYIEGYGYAIANDVGTGIHGNKMDMYMEEYDQCFTWGAQYVKVYILEYGDDTTYWSRYKLDTESIKLYDEYDILRETDNWPNVM